MKTEDKAMSRRMSFVLWFLVVAVPFYMLGLQYYFSSKGALASSAIAAVVGTMSTVTPQRHRSLTTFLTLTSPFLFIACLYLSCPSTSSIIYGLAVISLYMGCLFTHRNQHSLATGGRGELSFILQSISDSSFVSIHRLLFRRWSALALLSMLLHAFIPSPWFAFVPLTAIAAGLSSVLNSLHTQES